MYCKGFHVPKWMFKWPLSTYSPTAFFQSCGREFATLINFLFVYLYFFVPIRNTFSDSARSLWMLRMKFVTNSTLWEIKTTFRVVRDYVSLVTPSTDGGATIQCRIEKFRFHLHFIIATNTVQHSHVESMNLVYLKGSNFAESSI